MAFDSTKNGHSFLIFLVLELRSQERAASIGTFEHLLQSPLLSREMLRRHARHGVRRVALAAARRHYVAPVRETRFLMNEVYDFPSHYAKLTESGGPNAEPELVDMIIDEMAKFSEQTVYPLNEVGDKEGCTWVSEEELKTPTGYKEAYDEYTQGGWQGLTYPEEWGGQGLPDSMGIVAAEMASSACFSWVMFPGLSKGCINTVLAHASPELQAEWLPPLVSGEYTGTMCLTEPQCGSDLGQVSTKAVPNGDGTYSISGTKIFISCGNHDMTSNIVHCVLARLPDAPPGTRGISLFLVPKYHDDKFNGAKIGRIEEKMGCHGSPTCEINFDDAQGWLIGTENRGLNHMFTYINTSRVGTAVQGLAASENALQNSVWYARERLSMRALTGTQNPAGPADPIIAHPDVRRMLLTMKAIASGGRSMIFECAMLADHLKEAEATGDIAEAARIDDRLGFLTPILKGFLTERGIEAANLGIQVYGGHGYITSNKQEQVLRDVRIASVWEGTTGIQGLDLLGRKVLQKKGMPAVKHCLALLADCNRIFFSSAADMALRRRALTLAGHAVEWQYLTAKALVGAAMRTPDVAGIAATDYLLYGGYVGMAHHHLRMEESALKGLAAMKEEGVSTATTGDDSDDVRAAFYNSKRDVTQFYFDAVLPRTRGLKRTMFTPVDSVMSLNERYFHFD